ncbi:MAG: ABC transporter ATP-binding protein [Spirochaetota bacterium]|nr:MAG: ABC transporter ATP-binding protein [Spirochaetota bacterium]
MDTLNDKPLLEVNNLSKYFHGKQTVLNRLMKKPPPKLVALDGVTLNLNRNETLGLVGESGSGKSTTACCIIRLYEPDNGSILYNGQDVLAAHADELREIRREVQLIYQDPYKSLNPRMTVRATISEPAKVHGLVDRAGGEKLVKNLLDRVGLPSTVADLRPRALSGGQRQRVAIARALSLRPKIIIADEAVSALDVSIQAQILNLFEELRRDLGLSMILIAHQLSVVAHLSQNVAIMYLGRIVEIGSTSEVFLRPRHPYTAALLKAHPSIETSRCHTPALTGEIPSPYSIPKGCRFNTRCKFTDALCFEVDPPSTEVTPGHYAWCHVLPEYDKITSKQS